MFTIPRSFHSRVCLDARSGTQDLTISGPLATPLYCEADDRSGFTPQIIWPRGMYRSSLEAREPRNPTKSEGYQ
eukprot:775907-Pyramimonas_sp.AAC.1